MKIVVGYFAALLVIMLALSACCVAQAVEKTSGGLIPPPAIMIPSGAKLLTELNISDKDLLGVIKQMIPAIGEVVTTVAPMAAGHDVTTGGVDLLRVVQKIDFQALADAISGIRHVRILNVTYARQLDIPGLLGQLDSGVSKLGQFSRVVADVGGITPGLLAIYAQSDGDGYIGYAYEPGSRKLYAFRILGSADIQKFIKWGTDVIKTVVGGLAKPSSESTKTPASQ
ncbi:MAG: hypothetical protein ACUVRS_06865 [Armatimonadota bacterium]